MPGGQEETSGCSSGCGCGSGMGRRLITFCGEYPVATVKYRDESLPVEIDLEAFSPFVPLSLDDSCLPLTVMRYTVKNTGKDVVEADLAGWLENAVCMYSKPVCTLVTRVAREPHATSLDQSAEAPEISKTQPDIVFEDFEKGHFDNWTVAGTAFGTKPTSAKDESVSVSRSVPA